MRELAAMLTIVALIWALIVGFVWLVIGWRAMRAHEKIADAVGEAILRRDIRAGEGAARTGEGSPASPDRDVIGDLLQGGKQESS